MAERASISSARTPADIDAVRDQCRAFVAWVFKTFPEHRPATEKYFEPVKWEKTLAELPEIHARPKGDLLLARLKGVPVGCIMYHELEPGIAEIKRLFVSDEARGCGAGKGLVNAAMEAIRADGYRMVRLDTAYFLTAAIALYESCGFRQVEPFLDFPPEVLAQAVFMERPV